MDKIARDLILEDALKSSIEAHHKIIKYRRAVIVLSAIIVGLIVGYFI